ncbi:TonB-linked outer membrane protein, SusC/RagA family [Parapedobacter luteus]|uniref:TonB-linked outer membrane protein, SusC/RagA family n=1 Tax=Parapedobacter luteus TaxID=623280 RepID=A0A1T5CSN3_9SPHI|nr:SusC/RagA family TonB-linked outer membrane protein [Parapedobacter luteus]SKB62492.1 TonB-linked outer membrane protein, SusC/RagA family [Parapedobacter luteus]
MKLAVFLVALFSLSAVAAVHAQKVTLHSEKVAIQQILRELRKQTDYSFIYREQDIAKSMPITIHVEAEEILDVLPRIVAGQPFTYTVANGVITLQPKPTAIVKRVGEANGLILAYPEVRGRVVDSLGDPLEGASVRVLNIEGKRTTLQTLTGGDGYFLLRNVPEGAVLEVTFVGYVAQQVSAISNVGTIVLKAVPNELEEVEVMVSTGYQQLPRERATGSFVQIDNELFDRSVSTDVISRLKGITPSLIFDERAGAEPKLSIRGRSTIFANDQPLIVLDNFPYEGDINSINPNDIENISILRDAAAASIWGVRAANGVIVITTKKGSGETPVSIGFNTNLTVGNKPDLYYQPRMSSGDFIEVERMLFDNGYFNNDINNVTSYPPISPVIELLSAARNGTVDATESEAAIQQLKQYDIRDDLNKYFYRRSVKQQYALNFRGGEKSYNYYYSAGFDHNKDNLIGNGLRRISLSTRQNIQPTQDLELSFGLDYTLSNNAANSALGTITLGSRNIYPYARLSGDNGEALPISNKYRADFIQESSSLGLLDWTYRPLDERMYTERTSEANNMRFQTGIRYRIWRRLNAEVRYQYQQQRGTGENLYHQDAFYTRDLINRYTTFENGALTRNIPEGSILNTTNNKLDAHNGRMQLNYSHTWKDHDLAAIAGFEVREIKTGGKTVGFYGYDEANGSSRPVNYNTYYRLYPSGYALIPDQRNISGTIDRFRSYYSNVSYSYKSRYTLSASGRIDQSNLFGVAANLKAVPLWSIGGKWVLSDEPFYKWGALPVVALKATYGYNGNLDNSVTAFTTARLANASFTGKPAAFIISPPNPNLKWERVSMLNLGVEFASKNDRISGSFEYFTKHASDLIGEGPLGATTGLTSFRGNVADMVGKGFDLMLSTDNIRKKLIWRSTLLFSYAIDEITDYKRTASSLSAYFPDNSINRESLFYTPVEGRPLFSIYSYKWAGLDGENGNPLGYLNGMPSDNYTAISSMSNTPVDSLIYHGRAMAPFFGSLRNDFIYKQWSLSVNISYSFGHYFRKPTISYGDLYRTYSSLHADFNKRWQKPGDESFTTVPSMVFPDINGRDAFYVNSEVNVKRADLVRLQDIRLAYNFAFKQHNGLMKALQVYAFANNIGLLWTANGEGIDPDFPATPLPFTLSFGAQLTL